MGCETWYLYIYIVSKSVRSVAFNHDNTKIVSGSSDNSIKIWDVKRGTCISTLNGHSDYVLSVALIMIIQKLYLVQMIKV